MFLTLGLGHQAVIQVAQFNNVNTMKVRFWHKADVWPEFSSGLNTDHESWIRHFNCWLPFNPGERASRRLRNEGLDFGPCRRQLAADA